MADGISILDSTGTTKTVHTREISSVHSQVPAPHGGTLTDGSGTITTGGTSQQALASNTSRVYLLVQNVGDVDLWVDFGTAAVQTQPSILLRSGGALTFEGVFVPTGTVNVIGATTGEPFVAKEA